MGGIKVSEWTETIRLPGVVLGKKIENYRIAPEEPKVYKEAPTLAELRHAYFDGVGERFISPEYRDSVLSNKGCGEWTSTFLRDGKEAIERPENIFYDCKNSVWIAEGGKVIPVELTLPGWVLEYDRLTGLPSMTLQNRKIAEKIFGDDVSYFSYSSHGLMAVMRFTAINHIGPFYLDATFTPEDSQGDIGVRSCRRLE